jgi:hypothetical protein
MMAETPSHLIFNETPQVEFGTNTFIDVPVILQYEDEPLIEVFQRVEAGYSTRFRVFNNSGDLLAAVEGPQLYPTEAGRRAGIELRHEHLRTLCTLDGKELFDIVRVGAAGLKTAAELYAPDGRFIVAREGVEVLDSPGGLRVGGATLLRNVFQGISIGVLVRSDGSVGIGVNRP